MIAEHFVMLGKTVPETTSDGRLTVCTAGYDLEMRKPIRVYPLARHECPKRWSVSRLPLERNPKDSREESWKIRGDRSPDRHSEINSVIEPIERRVGDAQQREILSALAVSSISEANAKRKSLCVIYPKSVPVLYFSKREPTALPSMEPTPDLFGKSKDLPVMQRFPWHPRIKFEDDDGEHNLMLREWGCYELMRKYGRMANTMMGEALNLSTAPPLLCGNFAAHRTSWLVISIFHGSVHARPHVIEDQMSLFS